MKRGYGANRNPWQIVTEAAVNGDARDVSLWVDYVTATRRRRSVSYSKSLLARFGMREQSDEELAEKVRNRETVAFIPAPMYREVRKRRGLAELRRILEGGGTANDLARAVERCVGRAVSVVVDPIDVPKDREQGPVVPTLAFTELAPELVRRRAGER